MTFTVNGATPFANVAFLWGNAGTTVKTGNPCSGMIINVGGNVPPALCGKSLCAVDLGSCSSSAPIIL